MKDPQPLTASVMGQEFGPFRRRWTRRDSIIYSLGVGAGTEELAFTTDTTERHPQQAVPTFAVNQGLAGRGFDLAVIGDPTRMVHAQHRLVLHRPVSPTGEVENRGRIMESVDKRNGRMVTMAWESVDPSTGSPVFTNVATYFVRGPTGGGPVTTSTYQFGVPVPDTDPDDVVSDATLPIQALLYRCSGDPNIIHTDPVVARDAGFSGPILQGLCTLGFAARALLRSVCGGEPERFRSIECRFAAPGYPGDQLTTSIWRRPGGAVGFRTANQDGVVLLDRGWLQVDGPWA